MSAYAPPDQGGYHGFRHNRYVLKRGVFNLLGRKSRVFGPDGSLLFYCERKSFKLKEDIRVFADEGKRQEVLVIRGRSILDFGATYDVADSGSGHKVGALRRKGMASQFLRDEWVLLDAGDAEFGRVREDNLIASLLRRWIDVMSIALPQSYTIEVNGRPVGEISQNFNPLTLHYTIDLSADPGGTLDRRLAIAAAILLLNIEGRQG